jgi:hypothetical protein
VDMASVMTITNQTNFNDMAATMFVALELLWNVDGVVDVTVKFLGVSMTIPDIVFVKSIQLPGVWCRVVTCFVFYPSVPWSVLYKHRSGCCFAVCMTYSRTQRTCAFWSMPTCGFSSLELAHTQRCPLSALSALADHVSLSLPLHLFN